MQNLDEAIAAFRRLNEAIQVGDYVTAKDGRGGYVQAINGDMVSFKHSASSQSQNVTLPASVLTVNPGGQV